MLSEKEVRGTIEVIKNIMNSASLSEHDKDLMKAQIGALEVVVGDKNE